MVHSRVHCSYIVHQLRNVAYYSSATASTFNTIIRNIYAAE